MREKLARSFFNCRKNECHRRLLILLVKNTKKLSVLTVELCSSGMEDVFTLHVPNVTTKCAATATVLTKTLLVLACKISQN